MVSCAHHQPIDDDIKILSSTQVQWEKLNPARGSKSPRAATLWGDRQKNRNTGFLVQFVDGFSSPPHIHNVSYRGIVIRGRVHNADPQAKKIWMPTGSYWTQPAGQAHITSALGENNIAFIEIDKGPYLVKPTKMAFTTSEKPMNIEASKIRWRQQGPIQQARLWKSHVNNETGTLIRFEKKVKIHFAKARAVVIAGSFQLSNHAHQNFGPGTLFEINNSNMNFACADKSHCLLYIKSKNRFDIH